VPLPEELEDDSSISRVLVVDDNHINLQLLVALVRKTKLPFGSASNGLQALNEYKRCATTNNEVNYRYVIMDISMPVMDGVTAAREIRKFEKENNISPPAKLIALSGMGEGDEIKGEAVEAGFNRFLTKPVKFQTLKELLLN
jgi:CheY-like chemotaxis protein